MDMDVKPLFKVVAPPTGLSRDGAATERAPDEREHPSCDPTAFEILLERCEPFGHLPRTVLQRPLLVGVRVV